VPLVSLISTATGLPVTLDNDANNAAWAEYVCGAGRGTQSMVMLTLGTGIGSGIILDGELLRGVNESAGEIGHTIVQPDGRRCQCGQRGCLEAYASASYTARRAIEQLDGGRESIMAAWRRDGTEIDAIVVVRAVQAGDALACEVWEGTCRCLAQACVNIQHTLDPDRIVLAGGMCGAGDDLLGPVTRHYAAMNSPMLGRPVEVHLAALGNRAGFIGAALSVFRDAADGRRPRSLTGRRA